MPGAREACRALREAAPHPGAGLPSPSELPGSVQVSSDEEVALAERADNVEPFPLEHAGRAEPGRYRPAVRRGVRLDDAAALPTHRREGRPKGEPRDAAPTQRSVHEEASDPPAGRRLEHRRERAIFAPPLDPRQVVAPSVLTPTDRFPSAVNEDPLRVSLTQKLAMVPPVRFLASRVPHRAVRAGAMIEHAPAAGLHPVVLPEQYLKVGPSGRGQLARAKGGFCARPGTNSGARSRPHKAAHSHAEL